MASDERICRDCRWWQVWTEPQHAPETQGFGVCVLLSSKQVTSEFVLKPSTSAATEARDDGDEVPAELWTDGDFGCTEWRERTDQYRFERVTAWRIAHPEARGDVPKDV